MKKLFYFSYIININNDFLMRKNSVNVKLITMQLYTCLIFIYCLPIDGTTIKKFDTLEIYV